MTVTKGSPARGSPVGGTRPYGRLAVDARLSGVLQGYADDGWSGVLHVAGEPGGVVHFVDGRIVNVETSGAPGPEVVLLRSGQIGEAAWETAFTAAATSGRLVPVLLEHGLITGARLEAVLRLALADAMFVLAAGQVGECEVAQSAPPSLLSLEPGAEPAWLVAEASRRLAVLRSLNKEIAHDRDRVTAGPRPVRPRLQLSDGQYDILALADGRRTARDMAFALGRGVFALTLEFARMHELGLLVVASRRGEAAAGHIDPNQAPAMQLGDAQAGDQAAADDQRSPLPRRRATSRPGEAQPLSEPRPASALVRMLRLGLAGTQDAGTIVGRDAE